MRKHVKMTRKLSARADAQNKIAEKFEF